MARSRTGITETGLLAMLVWMATSGLAAAESTRGPQRSERMTHQGEEAHVARAAQERTRAQLVRYARLPDLLTAAHASGASDVYAEQERLAREHDAQKRPYRLSMPYRNPGRPCKNGAHIVAAVKHTLVDPARNVQVELWQAELHEAQVHAATLPAPVADFLERLTDAE